MKNQIEYIFLASLFLFLSGCAVIGGIFKAGVAVGIFIVVIVIVLIVALLSKLGKK